MKIRKLMVGVAMWCGLAAMAACAMEVEDEERENVGQVQQAVGEGACCGGPWQIECDYPLTCCAGQCYIIMGKCRDLLFDDDNCGECGHQCYGYYNFCWLGECIHFGK